MVCTSRKEIHGGRIGAMLDGKVGFLFCRK